MLHEKLPETIRLSLPSNIFPEGFSVLIIPNNRKGTGFRDFYLTHENYGTAAFMFGLVPENDEKAIWLAAANASTHIERYIQSNCEK